MIPSLNDRRGQGLPVNVVILIVLGLIILIILIIVFSNSAKNFSQNTGACTSAGGTCRTFCQSGEVSVPEVTSCPTATPLCCRYDYTGAAQ